MERPIADLHCDLLSYLVEDEGRSAYDKVVRCSIPQLLAGKVSLQILAVYSPTSKDSSVFGLKQVEQFKKLPQVYPDTFEIINRREQIYPRTKKEKIGIMLAIENVSTLCDEKEELDTLFTRIKQIERSTTKIVYISFTWNDENRFGGGQLSQTGLKKDGMELLDFLNDRRIAVDFSHASDLLARDILSYIDQKRLNIPVIASHSNMRAVENVARNLPDDLVKEILTRKGVIGINFVKPFIGGEDPNRFATHIKHMIKLGGEQNFCFGADFFYDQDLKTIEKYQGNPLFFSELGSAATYGHVMNIALSEAQLSKNYLDDLAFGNIKRFLKTKIF